MFISFCRCYVEWGFLPCTPLGRTLAEVSERSWGDVIVGVRNWFIKCFSCIMTFSMEVLTHMLSLLVMIFHYSKSLKCPLPLFKGIWFVVVHFSFPNVGEHVACLSGETYKNFQACYFPSFAIFGFYGILLPHLWIYSLLSNFLRRSSF